MFRSRDHGDSWQRISPDLTTNDPEKYQLDRIDVLKKELGDASKAFDALVAKDVRGLDLELQQHELKPVPAVSELDGEDALDDVAVVCVRTLGAACGADADKAATERD